MSAYLNLDIDVLRALALGVDLGSFARAADRLGRSPSAISTQIHKLEQQVGEPLFAKSGRKLVLTQAGESVLSYGRRILELNDEAVATVRGARVEGWVRFGLPQDFAESWLPPVLGQFKRAHPKVQVEIRVERSVEMIERVTRGELDLALAWGSQGGPQGQRIVELPIVWVGAESGVYPNLAKEPLPLVAFDAPCVFRAAATGALDRAGIHWRLAFTSPSLGGLWAAVQAGLGVTARTAFGLPSTLRPLDPAAGLPALPAVSLSLYGADTHASPAAKRLAQILKKALAWHAVDSR